VGGRPRCFLVLQDVLPGVLGSGAWLLIQASVPGNRQKKKLCPHKQLPHPPAPFSIVPLISPAQKQNPPPGEGSQLFSPYQTTKNFPEPKYVKPASPNQPPAQSPIPLSHLPAYRIQNLVSKCSRKYTHKLRFEARPLAVRKVLSTTDLV